MVALDLMPQHLERPLLGKPGMGVEEGQLAAVVRLP
jgi:hypothetical protein